MPCYGPSPAEELRYSQTEIAELKELLCSACRSLVTFKFDFGTNPMLDKWWANHLKEDQAREARELKAKNERALALSLAQSVPVSELTFEQRQLLKTYGFI